eukprot:CAMPEP_0118721350 /NCGR_PEP_ID=MMETSP0800-20121206/30671_1 /TAXON_ID=210618 ORGANISM="Striatella unipunctata, Strain CCMP2910" /NCGR_SAMPLE_ID=MMETSP0800 /ASSEMBLY_ACC=CAM_ASM_000638 /LENGTH=286 /DNA_ID=CAMNT_0006629199 /DNA_START=356 /DNA_END=1213 /DNA_ORIENTATION=-
MNLLRWLVDDCYCPIKVKRKVANPPNLYEVALESSEGRSLVSIAMELQELDILRYLVLEKNMSVMHEKNLRVALRAVDALIRETPPLPLQQETRVPLALQPPALQETRAAQTIADREHEQIQRALEASRRQQTEEIGMLEPINEGMRLALEESTRATAEPPAAAIVEPVATAATAAVVEPLAAAAAVVVEPVTAAPEAVAEITSEQEQEEAVVAVSAESTTSIEAPPEESEAPTVNQDSEQEHPSDSTTTTTNEGALTEQERAMFESYQVEYQDDDNHSEHSLEDP